MKNGYYHYTSLKTLHSIISNNELWLANLKNSNDPNEYCLTQEEYNKYVNEICTDPYHGTPIILDESKIFGSPFGISFTTLRDDISQWERYGDNFSGVAIKFNVLFMQEYLNEKFKFKFYFDSMKYDEADKIKLIKDNISSIRQIKNYKWEKHWSHYAIYFLVHYAEAKSLFKAPFFSNENEHRLFFDPIEYEFYQGIISKFDADFFKEKKAESLECYYNLEKVLCLLKKDVKYALMRNGINSYLSLNLNLFKEQKEKLIEEIILGPKCVQDISTLNDFLISSGYKANIKNSAIQIR